MAGVSRIVALRMFFEKDSSRKVETSEVMGLWKSLNEDERKEFSESAASQLGVELTAVL